MNKLTIEIFRDAPNPGRYVALGDSSGGGDRSPELARMCKSL